MKIKKILSFYVFMAFAVTSQADSIEWHFNAEEGTQGWTSSAIKWNITGGGWSDTVKNMAGFVGSGDTLITDNGTLGATGFYMSSPNDISLADYNGGSLNIKLQESASGSYYHDYDSILETGGSVSVSTNIAISGYHPLEVLPYIFMETTIDGESVILAAALQFTSGTSDISINFDAETWKSISITETQPDMGPGSPYDVSISLSDLTDLQFAEALANCLGIHIRSEYYLSGNVGGGEAHYVTQLLEVSIAAIPEPATAAAAFGLIAIGIAARLRKRLK